MHTLFLLTSAKPDGTGIGTIYLRDIVDAVDRLSVRWRVVPAFILGAISEKKGLTWRAYSALTAKMGVINDIRLAIFLLCRLKSLTDALEREFRQSGADRIWVTASTPELIFLALELSRRGIDIRVTLWDTPEYLAQNLHLSKRTTAFIVSRLRELLKLAGACSIVCPGMKDEYAAHAPGLPFIIMRHGIAARQSRKSAEGAVRIVFAGSLYAINEWNAFVTAMETVNWHIAGRDIQLEFIGAFPKKYALCPRKLTIHPRMPQEEVLSLIEAADIGYLPYWMHPLKEFVARTSFPGKMTAYSAAGLAIFHHGPESSSVTQFLSQYPYGVACASLEIPAILQQLERLIFAMNEPTLNQTRARAMDQELSDAVMMHRFYTLVEPKTKQHKGFL